ncbi:hypothetical protein QCA50_006400 [Cerrena zonata]|uniref:Uncharacterized protein n=1 Tax=Cerrena zonata TaxID=2478898 RepID=A0AAW0GJT9_9APHY
MGLDVFHLPSQVILAPYSTSKDRCLQLLTRWWECRSVDWSAQVFVVRLTLSRRLRKTISVIDPSLTYEDRKAPLHVGIDRVVRDWENVVSPCAFRSTITMIICASFRYY